MFYSKEEVIDFIYESYQKAQPYLKYEDSDAGKRNPHLTRELLSELAFGSNILITGSKGKGSVAHMLSLLLQSQGKDTGLFTGPHIRDFCERIRVNGTVISDEKFLECANRLEGSIRSIKTREREYISPIGITLAIALAFFRQENTSVNVLECGKGVRYDDVGNVRHEYGVITPVFREHTRELGATVREIAEDKSHIITSGGEGLFPAGLKSIFLARQQKEALDIFLARARECKVEVRRYGVDFACEKIGFTHRGMKFDVVTGNHKYASIRIPLMGRHQAENCGLAMALGEEICGQLDAERAVEFLGRMDYPGRMEIVGENPFILLDACINRQSVPMLREVIERTPHKKLAAVLAIPEDKDYLGVALALKDAADVMVFTSTENPHYHFSKEQAKKARTQGGMPGVIYMEEAREAIEYVKGQGADFICVLGTTSLVTDYHKTGGDFNASLEHFSNTL